MAARLWHFKGGLHLPDHNAMSMAMPVREANIPRHLVLPLQQHIGNRAEPVVDVGDQVLKGQLIARAEEYVSAPVHASSSGTVIAIEERPVPHPSGQAAPCIVIETDGADAWCEREAHRGHYSDLDPSALRNIIRKAGIVGLGGAGFPSFIKLNPGPAREIDTLILNGSECEPYITCDAMLMPERAREIVEGLLIMRHAVHARHCKIGVEDNKPEAISALREALGNEEAGFIEIVEIPTLYPVGGEKQLIKVLTGREVPSNGLPLDVGIVCHNVGTAAAVQRAVVHGEPLISRNVTITGDAVGRPTNLNVRFGTPISELLAQCEVDTEGLQRLVMGGPMMGIALHDDAAPVIKTTHCILATRKAPGAAGAMPCIRCGQCAEVCPVRLLPQQMYWYAKAREFDKVQDYNLFDCIECGCCSYVCPAHIPLVQYYRYAKTEIWAKEKEKQKADAARERHEFHQYRQEREKQEKEERHRKKREQLKKARGEGGESKADAKQAAIEAATQRVKAKRSQQQVTPKNTDNHTDEQKRAITEAHERRARIREAKDTPESSSEEPK
ncbi:MAG: electron transport complex subunit RsxC [Pseudomonadota bacterium]|nr:MAG: electron transport complex subunit RsxC [Pseudomonadota bacterium]